jgi:uncharacterized membrane protein
LRVILPLLLCWFAGLATSFTNEPAGLPVFAVASAFITVLSIGYFKMNAAIKRGDLDAVTSDEPPGDLFAGMADVSLPATGSRRPLLWTISAWVFIAIGLLAVIDTVAMLYRRPFDFTLYPGWAHLFAGVALLTLNRHWRIVALVVLSLTVVAGAYVSITMSVSPEHGSVVLLPFMAMKPIPVVEHPHLGAAVGVFLALLLLWPCWLLMSAKGKALFGLTKPR